MALNPFFGNRRSNIFDPFSLDIWDPFKDFPFPSSSSSSPLISRENSAFVGTRIDWKETPEAHLFKADLPGLKKEEVKVEIEDDRVIQISGERNVEKEDKNDTWHRVERSSGKFTRRFRLPENAKMDQVKASMENGVLTVTIPKEEVKKPDVKSIEISVKEGPAKPILCGSCQRKVKAENVGQELEPTPKGQPITEQEIRVVLLGNGPMATQDIVARFKSRIKTLEDKMAFADILKRISLIRKTSGSSYIVLRDYK